MCHRSGNLSCGYEIIAAGPSTGKGSAGRRPSLFCNESYSHVQACQIAELHSAGAAAESPHHHSRLAEGRPARLGGGLPWTLKISARPVLSLRSCCEDFGWKDLVMCGHGRRPLDNASAISYPTWLLWTGANASTAAYAVTNLHDIWLAFVSSVYGVCCIAVIVLTMLKRLAQRRTKDRGQTPGPAPSMLSYRTQEA